MSCKQYILNDLSSEKLSYTQLPLCIQNEFMKNLLPYRDSYGGISAGSSKNDFVNLDANGIKGEYISKGGKAQMSPPEQYVIINNTSFEIVWYGNQHNSPFIFYDKSIYYLESLGIVDSLDILGATYVKVDVSKYIE